MTTLLDRLRDLRDNGPTMLNHGICPHVCLSRSSGQERAAFDAAVRSWPEFTGRLGYPVPHPSIDSPVSAYHNSELGDLWSGAYGDARRRLLDHIIAEMDALMEAKRHPAAEKTTNHKEN